MDRNFFTDIKESFKRLNCMNNLPKNERDSYNYSMILETVNTLHTRNNSYNNEANFLSQTQPLPRISIISDQNEVEYNNIKLINACVKSNNAILCRKYINEKADFLYIDNKKQTYLHKAAKNGCLDVCQLLLAYTSININSKDINSRFPIHLAAMKKHSVIVQYLHRCGSYLHLKDKMNNTVLDYAIETKNAELISFIFEKSPFLSKILGCNLQELLVSKGKKLTNENNKMKKIRDPVDSIGYYDFLPMKLLGKGSFGQVYLVRMKENGSYYAMKLINKEKIYQEGLESYIISERNVMAKINSPFIVKLYYSFQTPQFFCLIMDYCSRGTLADILHKEKSLTEDIAKIYLSEILLGIEDLHKANIIYRDLKLENVLIHDNGHILLSDFGLAKEGIGEENSTKSFCGTIAYLAPEIIGRKSYGKCIDWYAFGVIMFQLLTGAYPIKSYKKNWVLCKLDRGKFKIPKNISPSGRNLLEGLLCTDYTKRIGYQGAFQIKEHSFFEDIDWDATYKKEYNQYASGNKAISQNIIPEHLMPTGNYQRNLDDWSIIND